MRDAVGMFQSPQWGDNSKAARDAIVSVYEDLSFSPRNGEIILKAAVAAEEARLESFSPRNGEIILKDSTALCTLKLQCFSPRNGEIILKMFLKIIN
mgnify:CR=1 FL=1